MRWFRKHHTCPCGTDWWDEWDCLCNDRCPNCDAEIEPDELRLSWVARALKGPIGREFGTGETTPEALLNVSPLNAAMAVEIVARNPVGDPLMADDLH